MNAKPPTPSAASQAVGEAFHASATDGSPTRMPPTENAKKTVGAGTFAVARSARIEVTAAPPNTAETSPIISPVPSRKAVSPPPTTRNTPAVATARAIARWTVGRSPRRKIERRTAQIGKVLLRSVASPAGIRWIAMKYRSAEIPPKRPREARRSQRAGRKVPGFSRNRARTAARPIANRSRITCPAPIPPWAATRTRIADRPKKKAAVKRSARAPMRRTSRTGLTAARPRGRARAGRPARAPSRKTPWVLRVYHRYLPRGRDARRPPRGWCPGRSSVKYTGLHERARHDHRQGGPRAQPQVRPPRDPQEEAGGLHGGLGLGEVLARLRHPLRGGAAPLCRVALVLCPAVPRADGEAEVRHDPRPLPDDLDRAEGGVEQPALDRRDHHRGPRLPPRPVRVDRGAALPVLRPARWEADRPADRRVDPGAAGGLADPGPRPARPEPEGRVPGSPRRRAEARLRPRPRGRHDPPAHRSARARQEAEARHRARGGPARGEGRDPFPAHRLDRDGAARGEGHPRRRRRGPGAEGRSRDRSRGVQEARPLLLGAERLPQLRALLRRARAPGLLVQLAARLVPGLPGARDARGDGPGPHRAGSLPHDPRRRGGALGERDGARRGLDLRVRRAPLPRAPDRPRRRLGEAPEEGPRRRTARHGGVGERARLPDRVRGRGEPAVPAVQDHRLRGDAPLLHALLLGQALPDLRRGAAQAGEPGGEAPRARHRRALAPHHPGRARLALVARAAWERGEDRGRAPEGDPQPAQVPPRRRPRLPDARPPGPVALGRREPAHPARLADGLGAHRRHLHPRRAVDRAPPARQREAPRHAEAAPRRRELGDRRRARRGDDGGGRLARRLRPGRGGPRRRDRLAGDAGTGEARPDLAHRRVPLRPARDRAAGAAARGRPRRDHDRRRAGEQPEGRHPPAEGQRDRPVLQVVRRRAGEQPEG